MVMTEKNFKNSKNFYSIDSAGPTKPCHLCHSSPAMTFCGTDSLFLCAACDDGRREKVWLCEVCEKAPAAVNCKADATVLCVECDRDIHSANHLACRHDRLPVDPFFVSVAEFLRSGTMEEAEAASWIIGSPNYPANHKSAYSATTDRAADFLDEFLDLDFAASNDARDADFVVVPPVDGGNLNLSRSEPHPYTISTENLVSSDARIVPEENSVSEDSCQLGKHIDVCEVDSSAMIQTIHATQLFGSDREARVLRYKEKRKNRKFEKMIRYASRKAYAERRPRIKGRFVKRPEDTRYDVVPPVVMF